MSEHRVILYANGPEDWRWRRRAANGETIANSTESYKTRAAAMDGLTATNKPPYILIERGLHGQIHKTPVGVMERDDTESEPSYVEKTTTRQGMITSAIKDFLNMPENVNGYYYGTLAEYIERKITEWESE